MPRHATILLNPEPTNGGEQPPSQDNVLDVLREFESGLVSLRALYQQRQALQQSLRDRESELATRDQELTLRTRELADLTAMCDKQSQEVVKSREEMTARDAAMLQRLNAIEERERSMGQREDRVLHREHSLGEREDALTRDAEAQAALASEHEASVAEANREVERVRAEIRAQQEAIDAQAAEVNDRSRRIDAARAELDAMTAQAAREREALAVEREAMARDRVSAEASAREAHAARQQAAELQQSLTLVEGRLAAVEKRGQMDAAAALAAREQAASLQQEVASLRRALEEEVTQAKAAAEAALVAAAVAQAQWQGKLEQAIANERAEAQKLLHEAREETSARSAKQSELEARLTALREEYDQRLRKELEGQRIELIAASEKSVKLAVSKAEAESVSRAERDWQARLTKALADRQEAHAGELAKVAAEAKTNLEAVEAKFAKEARERAAAGEAASAVQPKLQAALTTERTKLATRLAEVVAGGVKGEGSEAAMTDVRAAAAKGDIDAAIKAIESTMRLAESQRVAMERKVKESSSHLDEAAEIIKTLEAQVRSGKATGRPGASSVAQVSLDVRRRRLRLMHSLLRDRTEKVRMGSEALRKRFEQCESVLKQRAELAEARDRVVEAERRIDRATARSRAGVVTLCAVATIGLIGGLSWALARQVAPATFMATARLAAEGRGRTLNDAERAEWQAYHEKLLTDPRFHQMASERFQRVAMANLGTPADVKRLIEQRVHMEAMNPGELSIHLVGQGDGNTERTLNTFAAAIASHANSAQTSRADGGVTRVTQEARTGHEPLDNTRTFWALGMMGIGVSVSFFVAAAVWRRLAGAKTAFERDTQVAVALEETRWNLPKDLGQTARPPSRNRAA